MPRATCRCGEILTFPDDGPERIVCPRCSARIRVRRANAPRAEEGDGFIRFACACGRRLKIRVEDEMPQEGMCPDCGRTVSVPSSRSSSQVLSTNQHEAITEELSAADMDRLEQWKRTRVAARSAPPRSPVPGPSPATATATTLPSPAPPPAPAPELKTEAGLRVCPRCGKPIHLSSIVCRDCGAHVPKR
jgi:DNA-directed RNA polymerase subunit RPC12/RpoP